MLTPPRRDPARFRRMLGCLLCLLLLAPTFSVTGFNPAQLANTSTLAGIGGFVAGFFPPAHGADFLREVATGTLTTLACATLGLVLSIAIALPAAFAGTRALNDATLTAQTGRRSTRALQALLRALLLVLRAIPEVVWALLFVRAVGLGALPAVLAIGLAYGGMLGKVYAEILESQDAAATRALAATGASRLTRLCYGVLPQALPELVSYTVYRWECAIRASAVMGLVGAGGIGQLLDTSIKMMNGGEVSTLLGVFLLLVGVCELASRLARRTLGADHGARQLALAALLLFGASAYWLGPAWRDSGFDLLSLVRFGAEFLPPEVAPDILRETSVALIETLAMSVLGTVLALVFAALLAPLAAGLTGTLLQTLARSLLALLRGVPDLMWAALAVLALGLGPAAGVLALALHTAGVLGRLFAETLENAPAAPRAALLATGASPASAFFYALLPQVVTQWVAYTLYRWENAIRSAAVLGIVGAGGLGAQLYMALSLFQQQRAATLIAAMILLSWACEALSHALRRQLDRPHSAG